MSDIGLEAQLTAFRKSGWTEEQIDKYVSELKIHSDPEAPKDPIWYEKKEDVPKVKIEPNLSLETEKDITINGKKIVFRKLTIRETTRLLSKFKHWSLVMSWDWETLSQKSIPGIISSLLERAFDDYDHEKDQPGPFQRSILTELALILSTSKFKCTADWIMDNMDLELAYDVVKKVVVVNSGFFTKVWSGDLSWLQKVYSTLTGKIMNRMNELSEMLDRGADWVVGVILKALPMGSHGGTNPTGLNTSLIPLSSDGEANGMLNPLILEESSSLPTDLPASTKPKDTPIGRLSEIETPEQTEAPQSQEQANTLAQAVSV